ncbi:MAG: threonine synthase [Bacillota bacterium]|nr:threonine synthase [Bacillota bacterium]
MLYESTRGGQRNATAAQAICQGIASDGGLFVPSSPVRLSLEEIARLAPLPYPRRAAAVLAPYLSDYTPEELDACVAAAYNTERFDTPAIAPLVRTAAGEYYLELWHGPTCAFKDMALQVMPHLLARAVAKTGEKAEIVILVATSGDTGKAALEGFRDVPGTRIIVFYPAQGVSEVQKLQMVTQEGANVGVVAVDGNFDDAQSGVKAIFTDPGVRSLLAAHGLKFSSANSINWGRLVPQIAYYISAYLDLAAGGGVRPGDPVNFVVPTGNFGNILAAFYARRMGLPVNRLVCAANTNNVLTDFIRTGTYDRRRHFARTLSPSMDILISSNLERLLYELTGHDAARVAGWMAALVRDGAYSIDAGTYAQVAGLFWSDFADDTETLATIRATYAESRYVLDTHTAVGRAVYAKYRLATGDETPTIIVSTASPFKFNAAVARAILGEEAVAGRTEFELLEMLSAATGLEIPPGLRGLDRRPVHHTRMVKKDEMRQALLDLLL